MEKAKADENNLSCKVVREKISTFLLCSLAIRHQENKMMFKQWIVIVFILSFYSTFIPVTLTIKSINASSGESISEDIIEIPHCLRISSCIGFGL